MGNKRFMSRQRKRLRVDLGGNASFTIDISPGGVCVESMKPVTPGSHVQGQLRVANEDLDFTGIVCWAKAAEPRLAIRGRMGIRFTSIPPQYYSSLQARSAAVHLPQGLAAE